MDTETIKRSSLSGRTNVSINNVFRSAAKSGDRETFKRLLLNQEVNVYETDYDGKTVLMLVAENGHVECLECLVDANKIENINQIWYTIKYTALMLAAKNGHARCVECLINTGRADVNLSDGQGNTALMIAAEGGHCESIECLAKTESLSININNIQGRTALMLAAINGNYFGFSILVKRRDIDINHCDRDKTTALMLAVTSTNLGCVQQLLRNEMLEVNASNQHGDSAFMLAAQYGDIECVRCFLDNEMLDLNARNKKGHTAFMLASLRGHFRCIRLLCNHDKVIVNMRDNEGCTALMLAIRTQRYNITVENLLVSRKVDIGIRNDEGMTAFMLAVKMSSVFCLQCFLRITVIEEVDLIDNDRECDQKEDSLATMFSLLDTDGSIRYFPDITWKRPYIYGREQETKSVLKITIRNSVHPRCVVCFLFAGLDVSLSGNVSCSHTMLDKRELCDFDKHGQTSLIAALQGRNFESLEYLLQFERIRFHILVNVLRGELCAAGTISLVLYRKLCSLIWNHSDLDKFLCLMCEGNKIGVCVDYLLSAFICQINSSSDSALSLALFEWDPARLRILLEHVTEKKMLINHLDATCKKCQSGTLNSHSLLELLNFDVFHWNWFPKCHSHSCNALTRELVIRGFAHGCFEWEGKHSSPLHFALMSGDEGLVRYLVANLYLTSRDLEHVQRDTDIHEYLQQRGSEDLQQLYLELVGSPCRLEILSLLALSNWFRKNRNQNGVEKVQSSLPEIFRSRLPFINPMRMICQRQWKMINLDFMNHRLSTSLCDVNTFQGKCCNGSCLKLYEDI